MTNQPHNTQDKLTDGQYLRLEVLVPMHSALEMQRRENVELGYLQDASGIYSEAIRQLLDWHKKQVEEVLDRLEGENTIYKDYKYKDGILIGTQIVGEGIPMSAIEAERNKLKGDQR